jgi:hypothetical protein
MDEGMTGDSKSPLTSPVAWATGMVAQESASASRAFLIFILPLKVVLGLRLRLNLHDSMPAGIWADENAMGFHDTSD